MRALSSAVVGVVVSLLAVDSPTPSIPLSSLLWPAFALVGAAVVAAVGNIVVARMQSRRNSGAPTLATIDAAELRELRESRERLVALVAGTPSLAHIDPTTGLPR